ERQWVIVPVVQTEGKLLLGAARTRHTLHDAWIAVRGSPVAAVRARAYLAHQVRLGTAEGQLEGAADVVQSPLVVAGGTVVAAVVGEWQVALAGFIDAVQAVLPVRLSSPHGMVAGVEEGI